MERPSKATIGEAGAIAVKRQSNVIAMYEAGLVFLHVSPERAKQAAREAISSLLKNPTLAVTVYNAGLKHLIEQYVLTPDFLQPLDGILADYFDALGLPDMYLAAWSICEKFNERLLQGQNNRLLWASDLVHPGQDRRRCYSTWGAREITRGLKQGNFFCDELDKLLLECQKGDQRSPILTQTPDVFVRHGILPPTWLLVSNINQHGGVNAFTGRLIQTRPRIYRNYFEPLFDI